MKTLNLTLLLSAFVGLIALAGCKGSSTSGSSGTIKASMNPLIMGHDITIQLDNPDLFENFSWTATYSDGTPVSNCGGNAVELTCRFTLPGTVTITMTGQDRTGQMETLTETFNVLDPGSLGDNAPSFQTNIYNSNNSLVATFSSQRALELVPASYPQGNYTAVFSLAQGDSHPLSSITFEVSIDNGPYQIANGGRITLNFNQVTTHTVALTATDPNGATSTRSFIAYVSCAASTSPVTVNANAINVAAEPTLNFFTYSVDRSQISGGSGIYDYQFDFNGDGILDGDRSTSTSFPHIYSIYANNRTVSLSVRDTQCNLFAITNKVVNFNIPYHGPLTANALNPVGPTDPTYYYIQADLHAPASGSTVLDNFQNADVVINRLQGPSPFTDPYKDRRVACDYQASGGKATFSITGQNQYAKVNNSDPGSARWHGLTVNVNNINDPNDPTQVTANSSYAAVDASQAKVTGASYFTDGGSDAISYMNYTMLAGSPCQIALVVTDLPGSRSPCQSGHGYNFMTQIQGRFICPDLQGVSATNGLQNIAAGQNDGAFFCQVERQDGCYGGGGGGGGTPPIPR